MRQFILATGFATAAEATAGKIYIKETIADGITGLNFVLKRDAEKGGDILYPFYPKDFTYTKATYAAGATYTEKFTIASVTAGKDYTLIFVKKGKKFNERNKWTATVHALEGDTATTVAEKLVKYVNDNTAGLGLTATAAAGVITVTAVKVGEAYKTVPADGLLGITGTALTEGKAAFMDAAMIKDLFQKSAADAGFEYTYDEFDIYPGFEFNPLAAADSADTGFTVYNIRFTEPRVVGTREEPVYQIIQVAFPTGGDTGFADALNEYAV